MEKEGREEGWGINLIRIIANDKEERDLVGNGGGARGIRLLEAHRSIRNAGGSEAWSGRRPVSDFRPSRVLLFFVPFATCARNPRAYARTRWIITLKNTYRASCSKVISKLRKPRLAWHTRTKKRDASYWHIGREIPLAKDRRKSLETQPKSHSAEITPILSYFGKEFYFHLYIRGKKKLLIYSIDIYRYFSASRSSSFLFIFDNLERNRQDICR